MKHAKEAFKTYDGVFDRFTFHTLFKLATQGHFDEGTLSPVKIGKESNVFSAKKGKKKIIIKIYRLETCDFGKMYDYIRFDPRFFDVRKRRRLVIFSWVQKEFRNLLKAREAHVRVPTPHAKIRTYW